MVPTAFKLLYLPSAHHESSCLPFPLLLLPLASGDMLPTAASVLSTFHCPASWSPALEFRAWVVRFEVGCLSGCLIQQEHKGPATVVCTLETLKEFSGGSCGVKVRVCTARWELAVCNVRTTRGCGWDSRGGIYHGEAWLWYNCMYGKSWGFQGCFVVVFWFCSGTCSWSIFKAEFERTKGGMSPAGEMWHNDKMVQMMGVQ